MKPIPIIVCIPYWADDRNQAHDLCKLIGHMQQSDARNLAHFMLCCRQDCSPDIQMQGYLAKKFSVFSFRTPSPLRGWPSGPNGMFGTTMQYLSNIQTAYECIFWMEPDCVPMRPDWYWLLVEEWRKRPEGKHIVGFTHSVDGTEDGMHVNGNSLYDQQIARKLPQITTCDRWAWDWEHRKAMLKINHHTNLIQNKYKARNATQNDYSDQFALIHGFKDDSLIKIVASKFNCS